MQMLGGVRKYRYTSIAILCFVKLLQSTVSIKNPTIGPGCYLIFRRL